MRSLMPQQLQALQYAKPLKRIALFMEMRLGKSLVAIRWAEASKCERVLLVAPLATHDGWVEELLLEENAEEDIVVLRGSLEKRMQLAKGSGNWFIINYEAIVPTLGILDLHWDCIILDESTKIRNPHAEVTKTLISKTQDIPMRALLSGLPAPESALDYFEQVRFLFGSFMGCHNFWVFRKQWFFPIGFEWKAASSTVEKIKERLHEFAFIMTRRQAGLPDKKVYEMRKVHLSDSQKKLIKQIEDGFEFKHQDGVVEETKYVPVKYMWLARIAGGYTPDGKVLSNAKNQEILSLLRGDLKDEPVIIWFRFNEELERTAQFLKSKGFKVGMFIGGDKTASAKFKEAKIQILCAQAKCGLYGLDWSRSSTAIYYSNWYDGEIRAQSEDRIVHPKKRDIRLYIDLVAEDSIDEDAVNILRMKKLNARQFAMELQKKWVERTKSQLTRA